jgi:SAM-dependent methyltransferase
LRHYDTHKLAKVSATPGDGSYYDRYWTQGVEGWSVSASLGSVMKRILEYECTGRSVLDYGGGDGERYGDLVYRTSERYAVTDVSPEVLARRTLKGHEVIQLQDLGGFRGQFDVGLMLEVAEHLVDPVAALSQLVAAVRPGGRVILSVPNAFSVTNRIRMLARRLPASGAGGEGLRGRTYAAPHIRFFDRRSVTLLARDAGLVVERIGGDGWDLGPHPKLRPSSRSLTAPHSLLTNTLVLLGSVPRN